MNVLKVKKGETLARKQDKVMEWYLIQEGSVIRQFAFAEIIMHRNAIVGILENEWFACDYVANEDTTLIVIPCKNAQDLRKILSEHENFRPIFLRTAVEQRHQALCLYASLQKKCMLLHNAAETLYSEYKNLCSEKLLDEQDFPRMEQFAALKMQHRAENWEIANSNSLVRSYLKEYMQLMIKDDSLCVGAIMEAAAQMRRVTQGIGEMVNYLQYNRDILFSDSRDDIFHLFFAMAVQQSQKKQDISEIKKRLLNMVDVMTKLDVYDKKQMAEAHELCENYDFTKESEGRINIMREDCIAHIMEYAGYGSDMIRDFHSIVQQYRELPDMMSTDNEARQLRREITKVFYDIYTKAFMRSVEELVKPSPIMMMFFNFGFMDAEVLGETNTNALYNLTDSLGLFHSANVYTVYDWLVQIYQGKKEPSRNEFDQDFNAFLLEEKRTGNITEAQMQQYKNDSRQKVQFEIRKNSDLSADAKEKIKTALSRARNSYREVFVKDYQAWMKYESQGSFRLNKVARDILVRYCPFAKDIRQGLATNPQYQNAFHRLDAENRKKLQRFRSVYDKYEAAGGEITPELKENLRFYQM